jgi:hypothetical protein
VPAAVTSVTAHPTLYCFAVIAPSVPGGAVSFALGVANGGPHFYLQTNRSCNIGSPLDEFYQ